MSNAWQFKAGYAWNELACTACCLTTSEVLNGHTQRQAKKPAVIEKGKMQPFANYSSKPFMVLHLYVHTTQREEIVLRMKKNSLSKMLKSCLVSYPRTPGQTLHEVGMIVGWLVSESWRMQAPKFRCWKGVGRGVSDPVQQFNKVFEGSIHALRTSSSPDLCAKTFFLPHQHWSSLLIPT